MPIQRVAIIFDNKARPETTGTYCRRALRQLVHVEHYLPSEFSRIPQSGFNLYLIVDDGLKYEIPDQFRPRAFWAIDTHLDLTACLAKARDCDAVFTAQRDGAELLRAQGIESATWLPLACDPEIHRKHSAGEKGDGYRLPERPEGCCAQMVPVPVFRIRVITNETNRGFPAAVNQGIRAATGTQILLLNNDTIVTTGCSDRMLKVMHSDLKIGLVGRSRGNSSAT